MSPLEPASIFLPVATIVIDFALASGLPSRARLPSTVISPGDNLPALAPRALSALATASELEGWDGRQTVELLQRATAELAKGGTRRLSFNEPADWIDFASG